MLATFLSYRLMIGAGTFFIAVTLLACVLLWRGTLFTRRWLLWVFVAAVVPAMVANHAGWFAAEIGRQPWVVHPPVPRDAAGALLPDTDGYVTYDEAAGLRTSAGISPSVTRSQVLGSLVGFGAIYTLLGALWLYVLNHKIQHGPEDAAGAAPGSFLQAAGARATGHEHLAG